jgi:hypothetical protein
VTKNKTIVDKTENLHFVQKKLPLDFRQPPVALTPHYSCLTNEKVASSPAKKENDKR